MSGLPLQPNKLPYGAAAGLFLDDVRPIRSLFLRGISSAIQLRLMSFRISGRLSNHYIRIGPPFIMVRKPVRGAGPPVTCSMQSALPCLLTAASASAAIFFLEGTGFRGGREQAEGGTKIPPMRSCRTIRRLAIVMEKKSFRSVVKVV